MNVVTASWENRKSCENHERYRHCKRGGSVQDESQSLGYPEKAHRIEEAQVRRTAQMFCANQSASTDCGNDCCGKTAAASLWVLWLFYLPISFPSLYSAKLSASRGVLRPPFQILDFRICNFIGKMIPLRYPVKVRNDRPFLCLGDTISQKSSRIFWFYHALFGRV